jgi:hypothetical protein
LGAGIAADAAGDRCPIQLTGVVAQSMEVIRDGAHLQNLQKAVGGITATKL